MAIQTGKQKIILIVLIAICLEACTTLSYYHQSVLGQWEVSTGQRDIPEIIDDPQTDKVLKSRLQTLLDIRAFATESLLLPENDSYRKYRDIKRPYVVWNVFATPELSFTPYESCFPFLGCLSYRGYFKKEQAENFAFELESQGFDIYLGGVAAYSTLGWLTDPVLNTMLKKTDPELARLIFHELAHQLIYIKDRTDYNEAFAETVALIGVGKWLSDYADEKQIAEYEEQNQRDEDFLALVTEFREELEILYDSEFSTADKQHQKKSIFLRLRLRYAELKKRWKGYSGYDLWFEKDLNNAKLAAVSTYKNKIPCFLSLYRESGEQLALFYEKVKKQAACGDASDGN